MKLYLDDKPDKFIFNFIINEFNNIDEYAINSISFLIKYKQLKYFLLSNLDKYYDSYLEDINEQSIINTNIDENITIGVELECCNTNYGRYKGLKQF